MSEKNLMTAAQACASLAVSSDENLTGGGPLGRSPLGGSADEAERPVGRRKKRLLTKTEEQILRYIAGETALHGHASLTKRELARLLGRNVKTIDRLVSDLRRRGLIEVEPRFNEHGGQISSLYRVAFPLRHPMNLETGPAPASAHDACRDEGGGG